MAAAAFSVDEVVTSLILNFIAVLFVSMLIDGVLKDPTAFGWPQSQALVDQAMLPKLIARSRLHIGFAIAIVIAAVVYFVQSRTVFGMQSRAAGLNPSGAVFAGVRLGSTLVKVACLSGGLAGLAGAIEVMGVKVTSPPICRPASVMPASSLPCLPTLMRLVSCLRRSSPQPCSSARMV